MALHSAPGLPVNTVDVDVPYLFNDKGIPIQLAWAHDINGARDYRSRATEPPFVSPFDDPSIARVIKHKEAYIGEMIKAVYRLDTANDNPEYEGRTWFDRSHSDAVSPYDVEAACRVMLEAVLTRCQVGFCGSRRENRRYKRGFSKTDLGWNCEVRMAFVIKTLCEWKSVCKDVLSSDVKIHDLANAPASVGLAKQREKENNASKKASIQNDRAAARATAAHTEDNEIAAPEASGAAEVADVPEVPDAPNPPRRRPRLTRRRVARGEGVTSTVPVDGVATQPSIQPSYDGLFDEDLEAAMNEPDFFGMMFRSSYPQATVSQTYDSGDIAEFNESSAFLTTTPYESNRPGGLEYGLPQTSQRPQVLPPSRTAYQSSYPDSNNLYNALAEGPNFGQGSDSNNAVERNAGIHHSFGEMARPHNASFPAFTNTFNDGLNAPMMGIDDTSKRSFTKSFPELELSGTHNLADDFPPVRRLRQSARTRRAAAPNPRIMPLEPPSHLEQTQAKRRKTYDDFLDRDLIDEE